MSTYVTSDIHGCYDLYLKMLDLIKFSNTDSLYIIGDVFDRGDKTLELIEHIRNHSNIYLLKGNHEQIFEQYFETKKATLWIMNGGRSTYEKLMKLGFKYQSELYDYIKSLPFIKVIDKFILVHAGLSLPMNLNKFKIDELISIQQEDLCLWSSNIGVERAFKDYTIICGHNTVQSITMNNDDIKILYREGTIYIDWGCCFKDSNGKLACLRLDDMKEFYVENY